MLLASDVDVDLAVLGERTVFADPAIAVAV